MGEDITNKGLAVLIGLSIVISLAGIMFVPKGFISGMATNQGTSYLNITGSASLTMIDSEIDFGTGSIQGGDCTMISMNDTGGYSKNTTCSGFLEAADSFNISNTGGTTLALTIINGNTTDGTINFSLTGTNSDVLFKALENLSDCSVMAASANLSQWININNNTELTICDDFAAGNNVNIAMKVVIDETEPSTGGQKSEYVTFTGTI